MIEKGMFLASTYMDRFPEISKIYRREGGTLKQHPEYFRAHCTCGAKVRGTVFSEYMRGFTGKLTPRNYASRDKVDSFDAATRGYVMEIPHEPACPKAGTTYLPSWKDKNLDGIGTEWRTLSVLMEMEKESDERVVMKKSHLRLRKEGDEMVSAVQPVVHLVLDRTGIVGSTTFSRQKGEVKPKHWKQPIPIEKATRLLGQGVRWDNTYLYCSHEIEDHPVWIQTGLKEWTSVVREHEFAQWVEFLSYSAQNPAAEQLVKMGQGPLVRSMMERGETIGKSYKKAVGLPSAHLYLMKDMESSVIEELETIHQHDPLQEEQLVWLRDQISTYQLVDAVRKMRQLITEDGYRTARLFDYLSTIRETQGMEPMTAIGVLYDYRVMVRALGEEEASKYPGMLRLQHDLANRNYSFIADEQKEINFQNVRKERAATYEWQFGKHLIRLPETLGEIVAEGKALDHCVASYADRVAKGETMILFARKAEDPDTPHITIEVRDKRVIQARGMSNRPFHQIDSDFTSFFTRWKRRVGIS